MPRKNSDTVQLKVRLKEELRKKIENAARARGVTLNAEIVDRLEMSFQFGDDDNYALAQLVTSAKSTVEDQTGKSWNRDLGTYQEVKERVIKVLDVLEPKSK